MRLGPGHAVMTCCARCVAEQRRWQTNGGRVRRAVAGAVAFILCGCTSAGTKITPVTVPPYADCSGESPVDPCVSPAP